MVFRPLDEWIEERKEGNEGKRKGLNLTLVIGNNSLEDPSIKVELRQLSIPLKLNQIKVIQD